jgi:hypothetical protein
MVGHERGHGTILLGKHLSSPAYNQRNTDFQGLYPKELKKDV